MKKVLPQVVLLGSATVAYGFVNHVFIYFVLINRILWGLAAFFTLLVIVTIVWKIIAYIRSPRQYNLTKLEPINLRENGIRLARNEYGINAWVAQLQIVEHYKEFVNNWLSVSFPLIRRIRGRLGQSRGHWEPRIKSTWSPPGTLYLTNSRLIYKSPAKFFTIPFSSIESYDVLVDGIRIYLPKTKSEQFYTGNGEAGQALQSIIHP